MRSTTTEITVQGHVLHADPEHGGWFEVDANAVGTMMCPMFVDGSPDLDNFGEIEVAYRDA